VKLDETDAELEIPKKLNMANWKTHRHSSFSYQIVNVNVIYIFMHQEAHPCFTHTALLVI